MRFTPKHKLAAAGATLAVAGLAGGAVAATHGSSSSGRQAFINDAAQRLHVSPQQLQGAMQGAFVDRLNAAVAEGRLTRAQADRVQQRMRQHGGTPWLNARALHRHGGGKGLSAAATYLGLTRHELRQQLRSGKSLAQIAAAQGKSAAGLQAAMLAAIKTRLDKAVADGAITMAQEQKVLAKAPERLQRLINRQRRSGAPAHG
ncbi:MAG: hypothetical protein M3Z27_09440 [Actinomycetota bacterium]|nr:hypothetical protein [Actinomycetota bacterium]